MTTELFSPRHELATTHLEGQIVGFDSLLHPQIISLGHYTWEEGSSKTKMGYLTDKGQFIFQPRQSVITMYWIIYNNRAWNFLLSPGSRVRMELIPASDGYRLTAPYDAFVQGSLDLIRQLYNDEAYSGEPPMQKNTDPMEFRAHADVKEAELQTKLDNLVTNLPVTDPLLLQWGEQFVSYGQKRNVQLFPFVVERKHGAERTRLIEILRYPNVPSYLAEQQVYAADYIDFVYHGMLPTYAEADLAVKATSTSDRVYEVYKIKRNAVARIDHDFTRDFLQMRLIYQYLSTDHIHAWAIDAAHEFTSQTQFPLFREPIVVQLGVMEGPKITGSFEASILTFPNQVDNPFPEILRRHAGKIVILDFWASWCGPCRSDLDNVYPQLIREFNPEAVAFVFLSIDQVEDLWRNYLSTLQFEGEHILLTEDQRTLATELFDIAGYPHQAVFDSSGQLVVRSVNKGAEALKGIITELLSQA